MIDIMTQAGFNENVQSAAAGVLVSSLVGVAVFTFQRWLAGRDEQDKKVEAVAQARHSDQLEIIKMIGRLEAAKERAMEADNGMRIQIDQIQKENWDLRERLLKLETERRR